MPDQLIPLYRQLLERDLLWLDVVGYADADGQAAEAFSGHIRAYSGHFKLGGYKIFLDGSPQGRTAWMRTPYLGGGPQDRGYPVLTDRQVYDRMALALDQGMQLLAHCNGDAAAGLTDPLVTIAPTAGGLPVGGHHGHRQFGRQRPARQSSVRPARWSNRFRPRRPHDLRRL